jgi:hypothetical protein
MDRGKENQPVLEEEWLLVARGKNHNCPVCHQTIIYSERDVYFRTGLCGHRSR